MDRMQHTMMGLEPLRGMRHLHYLQHKYKFTVTKKIKIYIYTDSSASISILKKKFHFSSTNSVENNADIKTEVRHAYADNVLVEDRK